MTLYAKCEECAGTGWRGHGMGGDTCADCNGSGVALFPTVTGRFECRDPKMNNTPKRPPKPRIVWRWYPKSGRGWWVLKFGPFKGKLWKNYAPLYHMVMQMNAANPTGKRGK